MAGLAALYPSVLDYIGQAVKDALSALYGDLNAILSYYLQPTRQ